MPTLPDEINLESIASYYSQYGNGNISNKEASKEFIRRLAHGENIFVKFKNDSRLGSIAKIKAIPNQYTQNSKHMATSNTSLDEVIKLELLDNLAQYTASRGPGYLSLPYRISMQAFWEDSAGKDRQCTTYFSQLTWLPNYTGQTEYKFFKVPKEKQDPPEIFDILGAKIDIGNVIAGKTGAGSSGDFDVCIVERVTPKGTMMCKSITRIGTYYTNIRMYGSSSIKIDGSTVDMVLMKRLSV